MGDAEGALVHFEHAIATPVSKRAHLCVVALTDFLDRPAETEIAVRVALHHFSGCSDLLFMDAVARYKQGKWEEARECLQRASVAGADPARVHALGLRIAIGSENRGQAFSLLFGLVAKQVTGSNGSEWALQTSRFLVVWWRSALPAC